MSHGELSVVGVAGRPERDCSRLLSDSEDDMRSESNRCPPLTLLSSVSLPWLWLLQLGLWGILLQKASFRLYEWEKLLLFLWRELCIGALLWSESC